MEVFKGSNTEIYPEYLATYNTNHHKKKGFFNYYREGIDRIPNPPKQTHQTNFIKFLYSQDVLSSLEVVPMMDHFTLERKIRVWWLSHATILIQLDSHFIITDPIFDNYASPVPFIVTRKTPNPCSLDDLPPISVVLISHCHWDHLSISTLKRICSKNPQCRIFAPIGINTLLVNHGLKNVEFDWRTSLEMFGIKFVCWPAWHMSARYGIDFNQTLWCSWMLEYKDILIYFAGDTAVGPHFAEIQAFYNRKINLFLEPIGPKKPEEMMRRMHLDAEEAKDMADVLDPDVIIPIHYGTFPLGRAIEKTDIEMIKDAFGDDPRLCISRVGDEFEWDGARFVLKSR